MLLGLHLPQTISEGLAGALQRAADLKASWGDDFVSAEHLLQVSPWRAVLPVPKLYCVTSLPASCVQALPVMHDIMQLLRSTFDICIWACLGFRSIGFWCAGGG